MSFGGYGAPFLLVVRAAPLVLELFGQEDGAAISAPRDLLARVNGRTLLHYEARSKGQGVDAEAGAGEGHHTTREAVDRHGGKKIVDYGEDGR